MDIFLALFAGLGMIFIGSQFLAAGIKQAVGSRLRNVLVNSTAGTWRPVTAGIGAGAIIQSPNAIAFVAAGLIGGGALTIEAATLLVTWSYVGNIFKLVAAAVDLRSVALVGLGVVGIGYFAGWDKHRTRQHWLNVILGFALLLLGINLMITGTVPLRSEPWVRDLVLAADRYYPIGFALGALLAVVAQGTTIAVIVIGLARAELLLMDQAGIIIAGALLGMGFLSYFQAANLKGEERQLSVLQLILKIVATAVIFPLLMIEHFFGIPTVLALTQWVSDDVSMRLIFLWWIGGFLPAVILLPFNGKVCELLTRFSPRTQEESLSRPQYIFSQAADDPATALTLARLEQSRVTAAVPKILEPACEVGGAATDSDPLKSGARTLLTSIDQFLASTLRASPGQELSEAIMSSQYLNQILRELLEANAEFTSLVVKARAGGHEIDAFSDLAEPLHAMLSTVADRMARGGPRDLEIILRLGRPRDELLAQLRARILAQSASYTTQQQEAFYKATRLFERIVWLVHRAGTILTVAQDTPPQTEPALVESLPVNP